VETNELKKKRDELLREIKKEESEDYKKGAVNAILDMYNAAIKIIKKRGDHGIQ